MTVGIVQSWMSECDQWPHKWPLLTWNALWPPLNSVNARHPYCKYEIHFQVSKHEIFCKFYNALTLIVFEISNDLFLHLKIREEGEGQEEMTSREKKNQKQETLTQTFLKKVFFTRKKIIKDQHIAMSKNRWYVREGKLERSLKILFSVFAFVNNLSEKLSYTT